MSAPVVIVGAGPAGISCASVLANRGQDVVLIDDNRAVGGQYFRQLPETYQAEPNNSLLRDTDRFKPLSEIIHNPRVKFLSSTTVWGSPDSKTIAYAGPDGSGRLQARAIVIATGAQEKVIPFPGWTLPGVITAGGCLNLAKGHGLVPSGRIVVCGNGPLVLVVAATLIAANADVVCVAEAQSDIKLAKLALHGLMLSPRIFATAIKYRAKIFASSAFYHSNSIVAAVRGKNSLEAVCLAPLGKDGLPYHKHAKWMEADTLVTGYGLIPNLDLPRLFGCDIVFDPSLNGYVPFRSEFGQTSKKGIFAVGETGGIGGVEIALLEGRIAAYAIMGETPPASTKANYHRIDRFRRALNLAYQLNNPLRAATPDTIICRCEELTLQQLREAFENSGSTLNTLKTATRLGMGRCQGRYCLDSTASLLGFDPDENPVYPRPRPPLRPLPIELIAGDRDVGPAQEPDEINLN